jgi:hypothetical protein
MNPDTVLKKVGLTIQSPEIKKLIASDGCIGSLCVLIEFFKKNKLKTIDKTTYYKFCGSYFFQAPYITMASEIDTIFLWSENKETLTIIK